jgi:prepilin-type N-terminal cleavage/methylation domain-containing protein
MINCSKPLTGEIFMSPFKNIPIDPYTGQKGVTLTELMVVLGIMAILLAIAIPRMDMLQTSRLNGAARVVWSDMHHAKMTAIKENRNISVVFDGDGYEFKRDVVSFFTRSIADEYQGSSITNSSNNQSFTITFNSRGHSNAHTININLGGNTKFFTVNIRGRVSGIS